MIPSAYFWHVAAERQIALPYIPQVVWALPGELWEFSPFVYVIALAFATMVSRRFGSRVLVAMTGLSAIVHLVWGGAVLRASGGG